MTILHLRSSEFYGSPERLIIGQCRYLKNHRHVCASFVRPGSKSRFLEECRKAGIDTEEILETRLADSKVPSRIRELLRTQKIDLVVSHDYKANFYGRKAARKLGIPQVAYFHGLTAEGLRVRLYNCIDRFTLRKMTLVIAVSEKTRQILLKRGVPEAKLRVVYNAIDLTRATRHPRPERRAGEQLKLIAAGRFSHEKGVDLLLEAVARIKDQTPPFRLYLYGQGVDEEKLRKQSKQLGLDETVEFSGFVDDILPVLAQMDLLVMPSRSEGMPVIVLEAWSQELGIVATRVGGIPEMIESGKNGLLVEPENVPDLSEKLIRALNHPEEIREYGKQGFLLLGEKYSFEAQTEQLETIYSEALRTGTEA